MQKLWNIYKKQLIQKKKKIKSQNVKNADSAVLEDSK